MYVASERTNNTAGLKGANPDEVDGRISSLCLTLLRSPSSSC
eukprot:COSAG02_NODE_66131_length_256_cov_0.662420_1_plen_41_part_10